MSRRLEVELTSRRDDGSWTWRAAGARQPKGVLDGGLLPQGAAEGDVLRVDADFEIDGIFVTQVLPPKARSGRPPSERIELLGPPERSSRPATAAKVTGRSGRKRNGEGERGRGRSGERDSRGSRRKREPERSKRERSADSEGEGPQRRKRRDSDGRRRRDGGGKRQAPDGAAKAQPETAERPPRPKARKLRPGRKHRDALIASLPAEQQVVAEQVARGGLAAVRAEITEQNRKAAADGSPEVPAEGVLSLAESLVGPVQVAEWRDRADAAIAGIERVDLRDLRSVLVAAEDFARDAETRELADRIREGLNERVERSQREWHEELRATLTEGRVVRALRLSSRPPKAGAPLPPEVAQELTAQANAALGTGASQHRIAVVLEAVAFSPVRPYVVLPSIPAEPSPELMEVVRKIANRLPEVATAFGIDPAQARPRSSSRRARGRKPKSEPAVDSDTVDTDTDAGDARTSTAGDAAGEETVDETGDRNSVGADLGDGATVTSAAEDVAVEELTHPA